VFNPVMKVYFQAFLATAPGHPILRRTLNLVQDLYMRDKVGNMMGVFTMRDAYEWTTVEKRGKEMIFEEMNVKAPRNRVNYPDFPLHGGYGCCCNFVVHDPIEKVIFFFSRIVGASSRCSFEPIDKKTR